MDPDGVSSVLTNNATSASVLVVDDELRDLERSAVRITHERHTLTVTVVRSIHLARLQGRHRENNLGGLPRQGSGLQMYRS